MWLTSVVWPLLTLWAPFIIFPSGKDTLRYNSDVLLKMRLTLHTNQDLTLLACFQNQSPSVGLVPTRSLNDLVLGRGNL